MNPANWVGTWSVRLLAIALVVASAGSWLLHASRGPGSGFLASSVILSLVAFIAFVHTGRAVYDLWMKIAERIQTTVVTVLFSVCYLALVPPIWLFAKKRDSLRLKGDDGEATYWIERSDEERTLEFFQRLG